VKIAVLNGPNLNLLGTREPALYGTTTLADIEHRLRDVAREIGVDLSFAQHNGEGELIDAIHAMRAQAAGAIVNAGAYSHSSLAIRDALSAVGVPFIEVHLTNIYAREPERRHSMLAQAARGVLCGFGADGYELALRGLVAMLSAGATAGAAGRSRVDATANTGDKLERGGSSRGGRGQRRE
jgi:3-dehydroquinate dehydratase-2